MKHQVIFGVSAVVPVIRVMAPFFACDLWDQASSRPYQQQAANNNWHKFKQVWHAFAFKLL